MTPNHTDAGGRSADQIAASRGRYSAGVVIGAALAGTAVGALAVLAIAGITWKVRVELPPPPYPPALSSTPPAGYPSPPVSPPASQPAPTSGGLPLPPLPPGPH
jgi:hypothetical protein